MKNKINLPKVASLVMLITVTVMLLAVGTYAKYTSNASGTDATVVATWSFKVNGTEIAIKDSAPTVTFDLFNTINDTATGEKETDVADGLIAPGTTGAFEFILLNSSDVTTKYHIGLEIKEGNDIPLEFSLDGGNTWTKNTELSTLVASDIMKIGETKSVIVKWRWSFDGDTDASLGGKTVTVSANVTATQINYLYSEKLEQEYDMNYYSSVAQAIAVINNSSYDDESLISSKEEAEVALFMDENNVPNLVILKDTTLDTAIESSSDMILDLGGKNLAFNSANGINVTSGDVIVDGTVEGSKITLANNDQKTTLAQVNNGSLSLNGGTYETTSNGVGNDSNPNGSIVVGSTGSLTVNDANIIANDNNGATLAGVLVESGGSAIIEESNIEVNSPNGLKSDGIRNYGTMTIVNSKIFGYANYTANAAKNDYATSTRGINNEGRMTLKNCEVYGTHSGIRSLGTLYVDGGKYEGYGHGGFYFGGANTTSYVKNAYIGKSEMRNGYDDGVAGTNHAGFYVGGASNVTIYMDNCELWGDYYPFVMRISGGEDNNSVYISNSTLKEGFTKYIRVGTSKNIKVYIGTGNNFNAEDHVYYGTNGEHTDVNYITMFPEY